MAGKMIAAAPAIQLSKLYAGAMYKVMTRELDWDSMYPSSAALQTDMDCFRDTVAVSAGGNCWKRDQMILVAGDASEYAFAAYTPAGELKGNPIVVTFTDHELELQKQNQYSSTLREIVCILKTVKVLLEHAPELVQHRRLCYETDSQTGFHSVMRMKGNASTFPVVKELRLLCAAEDVEIDVVWKSRKHANQQVSV